MIDTATEQTPKQKLQAAMEQLGLTIKAEFVPFSQSRNKEEKHPSLNWKVTLQRQGRDVMTTDYMAGSGHCPADKLTWHRAKQYEKNKALAWECEHGFECRVTSYGEPRAARLERLQPNAANVVHSLVVDSDVLEHPTFEDWAANFGYEPDSRKAEAVYRACLEIALKLRAAIGDAGLQQLREAGQDY